MPIQQAYETDDVQLYRYAEENDLLFHPEIREVFSLGDDIRDLSEKPETFPSDQTRSIPAAIPFLAPRKRDSHHLEPSIRRKARITVESGEKPSAGAPAARAAGAKGENLEEISSEPSIRRESNSPTKRSGALTPRDQAISPRSEKELPSEGNPPPSFAKRSQRKETTDHLIEHMGIDPLGGAK